MAQAVGALSTYDTVNREDLSDLIFDVSPTETLFLNAIRKDIKAKAVNHEWTVDALAAAVADNAAIEGADASPVAGSGLTRMGNYTQILTKHAVVTGTQENGVQTVSGKKELARQVAKKMAEIKRDLEKSCIGGAAVGIAKVGGDDSTARRFGSIYTYLTSNVSVGAGGAVAAGNGAGLMTAGTDRDLTEALVKTVAQSCYDNGGDPSLMFVSSTNKIAVSGFAGAGTRFTTVDKGKLDESVDVYKHDFGTLAVTMSRNIVGDNVLLIDPEYVGLAELRPLFAEDLGKTGDSFKKQLIWEATLQVSNEKAHGLIADTNG